MGEETFIRMIGWVVSPQQGPQVQHEPIGLDPDRRVVFCDRLHDPAEFISTMQHAGQVIVWTAQNFELDGRQGYTYFIVNALTRDDDQQALDEAYVAFMYGAGPVPPVARSEASSGQVEPGGR